MKKQYSKLSLVFLLLVGTVDSLYATFQERSKTLHRTMEVNADALVRIENAFGDLNISSWDQNEVVIDVVITVNGRSSKSVQEKLDAIDVEFSLEPSRVEAVTRVEEGWGFKWFSSNSINYKIDYTVKLPLSNSVDIKNDYGSIRLNRLKGHAKIRCDYGKLIIGELLAEDNELSFDYTSNSSFDYIESGSINADYSGFDLEEAGKIRLNADYTNAYFHKIGQLDFKNDYGKIEIDAVAVLRGSGDYLTISCGSVHQQLELQNEFGLIRVNHIYPEMREVQIDASYTGIQLGIDSQWAFDYTVDLEYASFKSTVPLEHTVERIKSTEKFFSGKSFDRPNNATLKITSEYGSVKFNATNP